MQWIDKRLSSLTPEGEWRPDVIRGLARLRQRRAGGKGLRLRWVLATAAAVCLCFIVLPQPRAVAERMWMSFSAPLPKMAPDFTRNDAAGNAISLSSFKGKVVLLNFWATWCGGCKVEIPWFIEFQRTYGNRNFVVLGVSLDDEGWKLVKPFIEEKKINYPVVIGDDKIAAQYGGFKSLPTTLIVDKSGRIVSARVGLVKKSDYENEIKTLLSK